MEKVTTLFLFAAILLVLAILLIVFPSSADASAKSLDNLQTVVLYP